MALERRATAEQREVIRLEGGPARVLAGAGSGKTRTMVDLVRRHVSDSQSGLGGTRPAEILALTFTVKAAAEMKGRLRGALGADAARLTVSNFHSFALDLVRANAGPLGIDPEAPVLRRGRAWLMVMEELKAWDLKLRRLDLSSPPRAAQKALELLEAAKNELLGPEELRRRTKEDLQNPSATEQMREVFEERLDLIELGRRFERRRRERGLMTYADMLAGAVRVLEDEQAGADLRDRYRLVVVDEFQDTNPAQMRLVELLSGGLSRAVVIGDDLQSIYNFTGASIRNIRRFEEHAGVDDGLATYPLSVNFRSERAILELANHIARAASRQPKLLTPRPDAGSGGISGFVSVSDGAEAREIAGRIKALIDSGERASSCAVLLRRWAQAAPVLRELSRAGVPAEISEGGDLLTRPEIAHLCDYLRLTARPGAREPLIRALSRPPHLLDPHDIHAALTGSGALSPTARERYQSLRRTLDALEEDLSAAHTLEEFVERAIETTGLGPELRSTPGPDAALALQFLSLLAEIAAEFGETEAIGEFMDYLKLMGDSPSTERLDPATDHPDAVSVITVHRAKGLEFDHAFLPGVSRDIFPNSSAPPNPLCRAEALPPPLRRDPDPEAAAAYEHMDEEALQEALKEEKREEEARLFYVGATRARRTLTLSRAHYYSTNKTPKKAGDFWELLEEASPQCAVDLAPVPEVPPQNPSAADATNDVSAPPEGFLLEATPQGASGWEQELEELRAELAAVPRNPRPDHILPSPASHSPTSLMEAELCPRRYYHNHVFPLPLLADGTRAARDYGSAFHVWVEGGMKDSPPSSGGTPKGGPGRDLRETPYGRRVRDYPLHPDPTPPRKGPTRLHEVPFELQIDAAPIRGRMDAVLVDADGTLHLIDWKTGHPSDEYAGRLQLPLYALAANRLWAIPPKDLRLAYVFPGGEEVRIPVSEEVLQKTEARVRDLLKTLREGDFPPRPSRYACSHCPVMGLGLDGCPKELPR